MGDPVCGEADAGDEEVQSVLMAYPRRGTIVNYDHEERGESTWRGGTRNEW